jgi:predicted transcriptional regulator
MSKVTCDKCSGSGQIDLPKELQTTLDAIQAGHLTSIDIYRSIPSEKRFGITAINQSLDRLMKLGMVTRERGAFGFFVYTATAKASTKGTHVRQTQRRAVQTQQR